MSDNIQVIVRCRARNDREVASKSPNIIELPSDVYSQHEPFVSVNNEPSYPRLNPAATSSNGRSEVAGNGKVYKVDQVYGPNADQALLFENVAIPLFHDFVSGMNVTILAYGQTGSGKTYTMCGDLLGEGAGLIPRVLTKLFSDLHGDYFVKLSCVELYKEELRDLICDDLNVSMNKTKLRLVSDNANKTSTIQNLTEVHIDSCEMGFKILQKCLEKRQTSTTKMNDLSSRSHTLFTINLYRQSNPDDAISDYCVSRMNLVDLAGSEDINKSGAVNERAREAGSINQSLLSLGKVISSLSEGKEPKHIPYRESKLTRLLQGSIGGKTRTALIATISPAKINAHETISTLNYASKAKNIKNLPQSTRDSEMVLKKIIVQDLSTQIARITRDLLATKDKDGGIKMSVQNYDELKAAMANMESDLKEKDAEVKSLHTRLQRKEQEADELRKNCSSLMQSEQDAKAQLISEKKDSRSFQLQLSVLKERYCNQNEQLAKVMLINLGEINDVLSEFLQTIMSEKSSISDNLDSLKFEIADQTNRLKSILASKANSIEESMVSEIAKLEALLTQNLDVTGFLEGLDETSFTENIKLLRDQNSNLSRNAKMVLNPETSAFRGIIEQADHQYSSQSAKLKESLLADITKSVEAIFSSNLLIMGESLKHTSAEILSSGKSEIALLTSKHTLAANQIFEDIQDRESRMRESMTAMETRISHNVVSKVREIGDQLKHKFTGAMSEMKSENVFRENLEASKLDQTMFSAEKGLETIGSSMVSTHERAAVTLDKFRTVMAQIGTSPNGDNITLPAPSKRFNNTSPLRLPVKKRKPMSPLRDENGIIVRNQKCS